MAKNVEFKRDANYYDLPVMYIVTSLAAVHISSVPQVSE
jgi:hypothetical protein